MAQPTSRLVLILAPLAWLILAVVALWFANEWWQSGIVTVTLLGWLALLLGGVYLRGNGRAIAGGAAVAGFTYWLLALGPWFHSQLGPSLLTHKALVAIDVRLHSTQPTQTLVFTQPATIWPSSGSIGAGSPYGSTAVPMQQLTLVSGQFPFDTWSTHFQIIGHYLLVWLLALLGGMAAGWMQRSASGKNVDPRKSSPVGELV